MLVAAGTTVTNLAFPFGRPQLSQAADYVLARRQPGDLVLGNSWEQMYYFRQLGTDFIPKGPVPAPRASRLWLVITGATVAERETYVRDLTPAAWDPVQRRDFYRTTVLALEPRQLEAPAAISDLRLVDAVP